MFKTLRNAFFAAAALVGSSSFAAGFEQCPQFFPDGIKPKAAQVVSEQRELCFDAFAILHSGQSKTPVFVAERLNRATLLDAKDEKRTDRFYEEARLPSAHRAKLTDYKDSDAQGNRYDRGHMAPAADMPTAAAMAQSFSLANMVPQAPQNNRKPWADIEKATRKYVMRAAGDVFVFTGPVYSGKVQALGDNQVWIPKYLFKLVYDASTNKAWAHWLENSDEARVSRPISYEELVKRTGTEFLPGRRPLSQGSDH